MRSLRVPELLTYFSGFHSPVSEILKLTRNEDIIWSDIIDLKPIERFAFDKIVLMGDAAHATTPNMGQGACLAIEDAAVLANCIEDYSTAEEAFRKFEQKRIKRTTRIVNGSWTLGKAAQLENPLLISLRNAAVRMTPSHVAQRQVKFIHDISF
jgi:2-polyprenyl-6-methoxyphenol hydroxylase-like FAD-dependent oxidoreductase